MFIQDRNQARDYFFLVWEKISNNQPLTPLETIISDVIQWHPEYHDYLGNRQTSMYSDFKPAQNQTNPFLHMGMHIALKEQIGADRPVGIQHLFQQFMQRNDSVHEVEHAMMECLGQYLWEAQRDNGLPDENRYLECLKRILS